MINSLYLHVPFCKSICGYCDFCRFIYNNDKVEAYLKALKAEIEDKDINKNLKTIYLGGGTPTSLSYEQLEQLLILIEPFSEKVSEYTIEVNPETIDLDKVLLLKKYKVNRISIGVQSSDDKLLKVMNRHHDFKQVIEAIKLFKANGIDNISIDLMYGLPLQDLNILKKTLNDFISLDIKHISIYSLTIEENTAFYKKGYKAMDIDLEADMYDYIVEFLEKNGYHQYEISNFCKENFMSEHNLAYWHYEDFYGVSMGASGKEGNVRYDNTRDFKKYLNQNYVDKITVLNKNELIFEHLMMSFRLKDGFSFKKLNELYEIDFLKKYEKAINNLTLKGLIIIDDEIIKCNDTGYKILNSILQEFMD